jgi:Methyl-accepting chemotaxis protein-like, first PDC sensor domain
MPSHTPAPVRTTDGPGQQRPRVFGLVRPTLAVVVVVSLTLLAVNLAAYRRNSAVARSQAMEQVRVATRTAARQLDAFARDTQCEATKIASMLSGEALPACADSEHAEAESGPIAKSSRAICASGRSVEVRADACVQWLVEGHPQLFGASVSYAPGAYSSLPSDRLHSTYYFRPDPGAAVRRGAIEYDYTRDPTYDWFTAPMETGDRWSSPYYDNAGNVLMVTYSAVFRYPADAEERAGTPRGVVTIDISTEELRRTILELDLGASGYGALTAEDGRYMYHPNREYVELGRTIMDVALESGDADRERMWPLIQQGDRGVMDHQSQTTGERSWLVYEPVPSSGWSVQNTFIKSDIAIDVDALRLEGIMATTSAVLFFSSLLALLIGRSGFNERRLWILSTGVSLALAGGIGAIWALALIHAPDPAGEKAGRDGSTAATASEAPARPGRCAGRNAILARGAPPISVTQQEVVNRTKAAYVAESVCRGSRRPLFIDIGIHLENLRFLGENEVRIAGQLWERIPADAPTEIAAAFSIAKTVDFTSELLGEERGLGGERIARWRFDATVAQQRSSVRYPIEQETVVIELRHSRPLVRRDSTDLRIYLVPDLAAYDLTNPTARPGVVESISVPGWRALRSYFRLSAPERRSNLGIQDPAGEVVPPEISFAVVLERDFADAFISNLTPIIVVAIMLFAVLMVSNRLDYGRALSICVGMFFVIVFSHIDLRQRLAAQQIFYLEYFYFTIYLAILWVSFNCLLQAFERKIGFIEARDRLFPKLTYWPALLGTIMISTIISFH